MKGAMHNCSGWETSRGSCQSLDLPKGKSHILLWKGHNAQYGNGSLKMSTTNKKKKKVSLKAAQNVFSSPFGMIQAT